MITKLIIRNFKGFENAELDFFSADLSAPIVLIGPNNSGKTTALQALALWKVGLDAWREKKGNKTAATTRPGFTINRRDLTYVPVPTANLLWKGLKTSGADGKTAKVRIDVQVHGISTGKEWQCGFEFDYTNEESLACRPLRQPNQEFKKVEDCSWSSIPEEASTVQIAYMPPMSGLAREEPRADRGRIDVLLGEGQTSQVIRNLCLSVFDESLKQSNNSWKNIVGRIKRSFGVELHDPEYLPTRGEVRMSYYDTRHNCVLDLSSSGRGLQQTLLLLAYMHARPKAILLLDEPDAHLEVLRQRSLFDMIRDVAAEQQSQVIAASHSEVVLNEAATRGTVIAFVGRPHRINDKTSQVLKSLNSIGFEDYYLAELRRWVLYVEGPSDLKLLRAFAEKLNHTEAIECLKEPFVHLLGNNQPAGARDHFYGIREAVPELVGFAQFDRLTTQLNNNTPLVESQWQRREIENYLCYKQLLIRFAEQEVQTNDLFSHAETNQRVNAMESAIDIVERSSKTFGYPDIWSHDAKASDQVLTPIFNEYARLRGARSGLQKRNFDFLVSIMNPNEIDQEVKSVLDAIVRVAHSAATDLV